MMTPYIFLLLLVVSIPWFIAFVKLSKQPSGTQIFLAKFLFSFSISALLMLLSYHLLNTNPASNPQSLSFTTAEINQAVYMILSNVLILLFYMNTGISCIQIANKRASQIKKEVLATTSSK